MEGERHGVLYHEVQESKLCALHCVNTLLQAPLFSEIDFAALASDIDFKERQMMLDDGCSSGDFSLTESQNVSLGGDFSIQVLEKALQVWDLQMIPLDNPTAEHARIDPDLENAYICNLNDHWLSIRKVHGEWYKFDSLFPAPQHLSKFYLAAFLDSLRSCRWSIFLVRGSLPIECPVETSTACSRWLSPEEAKRIFDAESASSGSASGLELCNFAEDEEIGMKDVIAASLAEPSS